MILEPKIVHGDTVAYFFNHIQTNIWYRLPNYHYWKESHREERIREENFVGLIEKGDVTFRQEDSPSSWDRCAWTPKSVLDQIECVEWTPDNKRYSFYSFGGYDPIGFDEAVKKWRQDLSFMQWINLMPEDCSRVDLRVAIQLNNRGGFRVYPAG